MHERLVFGGGGGLQQITHHGGKDGNENKTNIKPNYMDKILK
jgi:hypothetical protein